MSAFGGKADINSGMILFQTGGQTMRKLLIALGVCAAAAVGTSSVVVAGFDEGFAAYEGGDYAAALKEFRSLAEQGDAKAQFYLGAMYEGGRSVTQDYKEAVKWYRKAAEKGLAEAQNNLGEMYRKGEGVTQDYVQAHMWFNIGAANEDKKARKNRDKAEKRMTASDISRAQKLAKEWMEKYMLSLSKHQK